MNIEPGHHGEPRRIGHRWFDAGITVAILLVSISSLIVAIVHSSTLERMADANAKLGEANSWPFLSYDPANGHVISMSMVNDGGGPAKITTIGVTWAGVHYRDAVDFLEACCNFRPKTADVEYELIAGRVLRAGQSLNILSLPRTAADDAAYKILNGARISRRLSVNVCYCSVFDQCWTSDIVRLSLKPHSVAQCTASSSSYGIPP